MMRPYLLFLCEHKSLVSLEIGQHIAAIHQVNDLLKLSIHARHLILTNIDTKRQCTMRQCHPLMDPKVHKPHHTMYVLSQTLHEL